VDAELASFRELLTDIFSAEHTPPASRLIYLSDPDRQEMAAFEQLWPAAGRKRRREVMGQLARIARDSFEYNFDVIFRFGLESDDPVIRLQSILGLEECEDCSLIEPMAALLKSDPSAEVRSAAATALGTLGTLAEVGKLSSGHGAAVYRALLHAFENARESLPVRACALEAIAIFNTDRVSDLIEEAAAGSSRELRLAAIVAMGHTCNPRWLSAIVDHFDSELEPVRVAAAQAAGELGLEEAAPGLIRLVRDPSIDVRVAAVHALGEIGGEVPKKVLESLVRNTVKRVRDAASSALSEMEFWEDPGRPVGR